MLVALFAAALAAAPVSPRDGCTPQTPMACQGANQLARDPGFQAELKGLVGNRQTGYLDFNGRAYPEVMLLLRSPADPPRSVDGGVLLAGCREHSTCEEKAAVLMRPGGQLGAVAVMHTNCARLNSRKDCFEHFTLSVFTPRGDDQGAVDVLRAWAKAQVAANLASPGAPATFLDRVEQLAGDTPKAPARIVASAPKRAAPVMAAAADPPAAAAVTPAPQAAIATLPQSTETKTKPAPAKPKSTDWKWHWTPYS